MNDRIKVLRNTLKITLEDFGKKVGVTRSAIGRIEKGERGVTEQMILSICREFNVNEIWLRTGEGNMFRELPEEEETAIIVSDLLEEGKDNPFYGLILEIMNTYKELSPKSQEVLRDFSVKLLNNLHNGQQSYQKPKAPTASISVQEAEAEYIKSRSMNVRKKDLSASNTTAGNAVNN